MPQRLAQRAYQSNATPIRTPRGGEYEVFARVTRQLTAAARQGKRGCATLAEAVHENRRLWTTLATDVAQPGNALPDELRARLFWLAEFTESETRRLLRGNGDVAALIEINAAVMHGLRGKDAEE